MKFAPYDETEALITMPAQVTSEHVNSTLGQILVVDDEVELKNVLVEMLNAQGYDAVGCTSAAEALSSLREKNFDVLMSDLMMPEMDGVALLGRALEIDRNLVCIIMTGQGTIKTAVDAMKVGAFDYVLKPFRLQTLLPVLTRALNVRRLSQENLQLRETVAIYELCQTIAFTLDRPTLLSKLADAALEQSEADELSILLRNADNSELYVAAVRGENRTHLLGERVPLQQGISSWVARERTPLLLKGQVNDARFTAMWPRADISSAISVPLQVAGKLVGIVNVNNVNNPRPFTLGQMKALTILASAAAAALESTTLYEKVRQAEEKYRSIVDNAVEGIFQSTPEGRFITVNPSLARILGYHSPEEVIETITDITRQLYVDPVRQAEATRLQEEQGVLQGFEFEAYRKDGEKIWLSENRHTIRDENGVELYREGTLEDITVRKRIEAELRESEDRYRDIVEHSHDLICTHDLEGRILSVNRTAANALGYESSALLNSNIREGLLPVFRDEFDDYIAELRKEGVARGLMAVRTRAGEKRIWEYTNTLRTKGVAMPIVRGMAHDVTKQKHAEAELRRSEEQYRRLLDTTYEGVMVFDAGMQITYVNQRLTEMLGVNAEEVIGHSALNFVATTSRGDLERQWQHRKEGVKDQYDLCLQRKDGSELWAIVCATPITGVNGEFIGSLSMLTDITERKRAEEALRASEAELRALFGAMTDVILVLDAQGRYLKIAPTDPAYLYKPSADLLGKRLDEVFPQEDITFFLEHIHRALDEGQMHRVEYSLHISGMEIWFDGSVSPVSKDSVIWIARDITKRKQADAMLRESEEKYRSIVETTNEGIWLLDLDGRTSFVNQQLAGMLGYTVAEMVGQPIFNFVFPSDVVVVEQKIVERQQGTSETGEFLMRRKDGSAINTFYNASPIKNHSGAIVGALSMITDITERKRIEEMKARRAAQLALRSDINAALADSSAPLQRILGNCVESLVPHLGAAFARIWTLNEEEDMLELQASAGMYTHIDGPHARVPVGALKIGLIAEERKPHISNDVQTDPLVSDKEWARQEGMISFAGYPLIVEDRLVGVMAMFAKQKLADDTLDVLASLADIISQGVERKRAEKELLQSEQRYRLLFEQNPQPMWVFDLETLAFLEVNDAAIHHYGYAREEFLAMTIKDIRPSEEIPNLIDHVSRSIPQHEEAAVWKHKKKDGSLIDVEINFHELTFYGRPAQIVLAYDVTERRSLEEQLRQSQKLEAVGQLAGGVAHDFNNLLTVITGYSDLALRRLDKSHPIRSNLEEIKKAGERAASLTRQLLAFSRKQVLQPKVLQLNAIVTDVDRMLRRLIGEDIDPLTLLEPSLGQIKADPGQIEQVILNLAVNARDAMPQGGKLTIETQNVYLDNYYAKKHTAIQPGNYVMLAVSDTGCGIDAETQVRMFEPFFTTKEQGKGTGLGLSTVYGIVKQSGGHLWVYSEIGKGTTFKIYLPRIDGVTERDETRGALADLPQGRETVLLSEDEEQVRQMIRIILEMNGYRVLAAASGEEALAIYKQHEGQIDLLMTDVVMPQMSGRELAQTLEILHTGIKVLYMSGYTDDAIVRHGLLDREIAFLQKPFTPDALMRKVREVLDAPHAA